MHKHNFLLSLITVMTILASAEAKGERVQGNEGEMPRLVVNILIDQLRSDYLETFSPLYVEDGFQQLLRDGCYYRQAVYSVVPRDRVVGTATLATGTTPSNHGIVGERFLHRETLRPTVAVEDATVQGRGTTDRFSPASLLVTTLADELKLATGGHAYVVSIAPQATMAILSGGHAADQAVWIDDRNGQWVTSSYYGELPLWADLRNTRQSIDRRLAAGTWQPLQRNKPTVLLNGTTVKPFSHRMAGSGRFGAFKTSAMVNDEMAAAVADVLNNTALGADGTPDLLNVALYAGTYNGRNPAVSALELQDTYVRLDRAMSTIIQSAEAKAGKGRVLFTLAGTGTFDREQTDDERLRLPGGLFDMRRAVSLLNIYLANLYGKGNYIDATFGTEIFFNRRRISEQRIDFGELQRRAADFLLDLSGVKTVYTGRELLTGASNQASSAAQAAYFPQRSGDVIIVLRPGWRSIGADGQTSAPVTAARTDFPLIFYGCGIARRQIGTPVCVEYLAPTVSKALRIRAPSGCAHSPLF